MTATAMYRTIERITLKHDQATMILPAILEAWAEGRKNTGLLRNLAQKFKPDTEDIVLPKTIYILPQVEVVEGFAICSVTLTYCSTLLIGMEEAIVELEKFLRSLFKTLFPTKPPKYSWWSSEFSWNRFCRLSIQVSARKQRDKWECASREDVSALLLGVDRDSTSTGCRGLGELLGYGRVSEKVYDADSLRWQCIQCLKSSESGATYTSLRKAPSDEHSLDVIGVNVDNDSPAFHSDSKLSVDLSVDGDSPAFQSDSESSADLSVNGDGDSNQEDLIPEEGSTFDCEGIVDQMSGIDREKGLPSAQEEIFLMLSQVIVVRCIMES
jgi:hypothetical protein